jgi:integrase
MHITHTQIAEIVGSHPWASAKLLNNYLIPLRGVFALLYKGRDALDSPMVGIQNAKVVKKEPDPLSAEERDLILSDMRAHYDVRVWAYFAWAFFTGMRPEEIIALRWSDVDFRSGSCRVQRVRTFKGTEREGSKTHSTREVLLTPQAMEALTAMRPYTQMKAGDIFEHPALGAPWHDDRAQRDTFWKPTLARLGIRARRPYTTRHTCASVALMAGVNPAFMSQQLGHSTRMFLDIYARWINGKRDLDQMALLAKAAAPAEPTAPFTAPLVGVQK